ncbi:20s proteasome subunit, putative [Bodo saltans]|uniref:Proteasome subunit beta n=1 Tax=Bodo saltans TaxID=75058 RepID=A0A0S4IKM4_BODSA|nr:20s proteasome subunit, putative [Bodo saltans]|eukprot:CUF10628.1 20s proteasome subunit, putative [Bodo saltans]
MYPHKFIPKSPYVAISVTVGKATYSMASGGSVIGIKYDGGVLIASDTLLSYGSLAKWPNIPRIKILGSSSAVCASGDYADFQEVTKILESRINEDAIAGDAPEMDSWELFSTLHRFMYQKRCDFEPAVCQFVFAGSNAEGKTILAGVDDIGTKWEADCVGSGYGAHISIPLLRKVLDAKNNKITRDEALAVVQDCLRVTFYRECRAINKFQIADISAGKVVISDPFSLETKWDFAGFAFEKTAIIR